VSAPSVPPGTRRIPHSLKGYVSPVDLAVIYTGLPRWIIERFLYRLAGSKHKDSFVLKGAMLFESWGSKVYRPTKDLDLLGFGSANVVADRIREICFSANGGCHRFRCRRH
jgi:hypothetical protein